MPLFLIFIIFNNHSHSTIIHSFIHHHSPRHSHETVPLNGGSLSDYLKIEKQIFLKVRKNI
jgi:hypothetical protein